MPIPRDAPGIEQNKKFTTMSSDPYQTPLAHPDKETAELTTVPPLVIEHLRGTRPWVRFCSLTGYIASGFLILIALYTVRMIYDILPLHYSLLLGFFYLIMAILFIFPSIYLSRYEKSITHLTVSHRLEDLEQALADQRAFWKQMAIMILLILTLYLMTIAFSAIAILLLR